jgi:hypothetical protein
MGRVRLWLDLLTPPIMPKLHPERWSWMSREGELDPWLCNEQPLLFFAPCCTCSCVLKEAWLWRSSEGRVGSYAFKPKSLLLASPKISYPTFNGKRNVWFKVQGSRSLY